jgi:hypothetical protein
MIFRQPAGEQISRKEKKMANEEVEFEEGALPPVGVITAAGRQEARRHTGGDDTAAAILVGVVALAIAALSAVAVWFQS